MARSQAPAFSRRKIQSTHPLGCIPKLTSDGEFRTESSRGVAVVLPSAGYLHDTVSPANVTVDYVGTVLSADETDTKINGEIVYSYTLATP